jgi:hypothetical protein
MVSLVVPIIIPGERGFGSLEINVCPCCGATPSIKHKTECHGHGTYIEEWWIECVCGMRTAPFAEYNATSSQCACAAARVWNARPQP